MTGVKGQRKEGEERGQRTPDVKRWEMRKTGFSADGRVRVTVHIEFGTQNSDDRIGGIMEVMENVENGMGRPEVVRTGKEDACLRETGKREWLGAILKDQKNRRAKKI